MRVEVFLLFFNAVFAILLAAVLVVRILRREYRPVIRRLRHEEAVARGGDSKTAGLTERGGR